LSVRSPTARPLLFITSGDFNNAILILLRQLIEHISIGNSDLIDAELAKGPVFSAVQNVVVGPLASFRGDETIRSLSGAQRTLPDEPTASPRSRLTLNRRARREVPRRLSGEWRTRQARTPEAENATKPCYRLISCWCIILGLCAFVCVCLVMTERSCPGSRSKNGVAELVIGTHDLARSRWLACIAGISIDVARPCRLNWDCRIKFGNDASAKIYSAGVFGFALTNVAFRLSQS